MNLFKLFYFLKQVQKLFALCFFLQSSILATFILTEAGSRRSSCAVKLQLSSWTITEFLIHLNLVNLSLLLLVSPDLLDATSVQTVIGASKLCSCSRPTSILGPSLRTHKLFLCFDNLCLIMKLRCIKSSSTFFT